MEEKMNIKKIALLAIMTLTVAPSAYGNPNRDVKQTLGTLGAIFLATYGSMLYCITRSSSKAQLSGLLGSYIIGCGSAAAFVIHKLNQEDATENKSQTIKSDETITNAHRRIQTIGKHLTA